MYTIKEFLPRSIPHWKVLVDGFRSGEAQIPGVGIVNLVATQSQKPARGPAAAQGGRPTKQVFIAALRAPSRSEIAHRRCSPAETLL